MFRQMSRSARRRPYAACAAAALTLGVLAGAARLLAPPRLASVAEFPRVRPADLAHLLADVSAHTLIPSPWTLEEEAGNYTAWRYAVSFTCGARCTGRASVHAHDVGKRVQHGDSNAHRVLVRREQCSALPLLPLPGLQLCDEIEIEWSVTGTGAATEGARLQETARARCGALAAMLAQCPGAAALRAARERHLQHLRDLLRARAPRLRT